MSASRLKKSILASAAAVGLVLGGSAFAQGASELNTSWGGYVVCIDKISGDMKLRWDETCPAGYTTKLFGARGLRGFTGETGATGATGAAGANGVDGTNGTNGTNGVDGAVGPAGPAGIDATQESIWVPASQFVDSVAASKVIRPVQSYNHEVLDLPSGFNFTYAAPIVLPSTWSDKTSLKAVIYYMTDDDNASTWTLEAAVDGYKYGDALRYDRNGEFIIAPDSTVAPGGLQMAEVNLFVVNNPEQGGELFTLDIGRWSTAENLNAHIYVLGVKLSPISNVCPANFTKAVC